jgi:predicted DNA-binding transcriptional regulator AlpA
MTLPTDLIPLSSIAKRLSVRPSELVRLSISDGFPPIYRIGTATRVSESAVASWLQRRTAKAIAEQQQAIEQAISRKPVRGYR